MENAPRPGADAGADAGAAQGVVDRAAGFALGMQALHDGFAGQLGGHYSTSSGICDRHSIAPTGSQFAIGMGRTGFP